MFLSYWRLFFRGSRIRKRRIFSGQDIIIEPLLPVDVSNGILDALLFFQQCLLLCFQNDFALRDRFIALEAQGDIFFHVRHAHITVLQTVQTIDPDNILIIENTAVLAVPLYIGHQTLVAIELQIFISHARLFAGLLHSVHIAISNFGKFHT